MQPGMPPPMAMIRTFGQEERTAGYEGSVYTKENLRRVGSFAKPHTGRIVVFVLLSIIAAIVAVATPILAGRVVDYIVADGQRSVVAWMALAIAAFGILEAVIGVANRMLSAQIGEGLILDLRQAVFTHVQKMPIAFFMRTRTGALVSRMNNDILGAQRAFANTLSGVVSNAVQLLLTLIVMGTLSWRITIVTLLLVPIFLIPARYMGRRLAALRRENDDLNAVMTDQMTERFNAGGAILVKLFGRPEWEAEEFRVRADRVRDIGVRTGLNMGIFVNSLTLMSSLALAVVYGVGGWLALSGDMEAGAVVSLALLLTRLYGPLTTLSNARVEIMSAMVSFERVFEVLDLRPLITDAPNAVELPSGPVSVSFDDVHFAYPSAQEVSLASLEDVAMLDTRGGVEILHGISFTAAPGDMVAIVGSSGAGKSTIASLIPRLYDVNSGSIRINDIDIREVSGESMRRTVGMVTQDGHLFHDTVRANLRFAEPSASEEQLWEALRRARLAPTVEQLPDGLDTVIGDRGYRLSGGERQRLTIARLLLQAPSVVVLDEATSALDSTSEAAVQAALAEAMADRTAIVIAHRLSTVRAANTILVVEGGRIVERGTHAELLRLGGRYAELYRVQFADQE